jgi:hypothetical protein
LLLLIGIAGLAVAPYRSQRCPCIGGTQAVGRRAGNLSDPGIVFFLYGKTSSQLGVFHSRLEIQQRYLLANIICEGLSTAEERDKARAALELLAAQDQVGRPLWFGHIAQRSACDQGN